MVCRAAFFRIGIVLALFALAAPARAWDSDAGNPVPFIPHGSRAGLATVRSGPSVTAAPETVHVGFTPGHSADNYWSIWSGSGTAGYGHPPARLGLWDVEPSYADVRGDSLQGWWPYRFQMTGTGGLTLPDTQRPWWALDYGNSANYVPPSGNRRTVGVTGVWHVDGGNA